MIKLTVSEGRAAEEVEAVKELVKSAVGYNTIFERLDAMETEINGIKGIIDSLNNDFIPEKATDINNKDLNECIGKVIFGYGNACTNKPTTSNGYSINLTHDSKPTLYNKQVWFSRNSNEVWVRNMENGVWNAWQPVRYDSGWKTLTLESGVSAYSNAQLPQYRKVGNVVYVRGAVKGVTQLSKVIAILPEGCRPSQVRSYVQNTTVQDSHPHFTRMQIQTDGSIEIKASTNDISANTWFPIETSFLND